VSCPEISPLVPRFFDGELSGRQMRSVALHITRCVDCESELRLLEKLQSLVAADVAGAVDGIDFSGVWESVSRQIGEVSTPWPQRLRAWWKDLEMASPMAGWQVAAAAAAVLAGVYFLPAGGDPKVVQTVEVARRIAAIAREEGVMNEVNNSVEFESIIGSVDSLVVDPDTHTAVLWVNDSGGFR